MIDRCKHQLAKNPPTVLHKDKKTNRQKTHTVQYAAAVTLLVCVVHQGSASAVVMHINDFKTNSVFLLNH